ncbi:MAG: aminotransferase class I/II-fold pyridoxal phosphate-dependent enzyme, partial [Candidatus Micrarchaeaceae archaeon]
MEKTEDFVINKISKIENPLAELAIINNNLTKKGFKILNLTIGDPSRYMKTPKFIIDEYIKALKMGKTFYEDWNGNKKLKLAVSERYKKLYNINYNPECVIITQGVSEALQFTNSSLLSNGKKAIIIAPFFTQYLPNIIIEGAKPVFSYHDFSNNWEINTESLLKSIKNSGKNKPK